jgi:hypothetical protein
MRTVIRSCLMLVVAGLLIAACSGASTPSPSAAAADPTPTATPTPVPSVTPTPVPTTDGQGDEYVVGTETIGLKTPYTETKVGNVMQLRGGVVAITAMMNDPRVSGDATFAFSADLYTKVGSEWGSYHLENANGAWDGTCSGGTWDNGNAAMWSCWLTGSGDYKGYTYYRQFTGGDAGSQVQGIIYPGSPPKP